MTKPKRIQRKMSSGWRMPENTVYVGRPTKWGNPFIVGCCYRVGEYLNESGRRRIGPECCRGLPLRNKRVVKLKTKTECVELFRVLIDNSPRMQKEAKAELRGKDLACWCPLNCECHADVLLELANR